MKKVRIINLLFISIMLVLVLSGGLIAQTPQRGGELTVMLEDEPPHLDSHTSEARLGRTISDPIHVTLVTYDEDLAIMAYLAKSWEAVDDTTFHFEIHSDVYFHNGRKLIAEDVKKSIQRIQDPTTGSYIRPRIQVIESVEVIDDTNLYINLQRPFAPLLDELTRIVIVPTEVEDQRNNPVGAGPFKFVRWDKDQRVVLERNEDFFIEGLPYLDRLIFRFVPEYSSQISMLETGEADVHLWLSHVDIPRLEAQGFNLIGRNLQGFYYLAFNLEREPWNNPELREAIALGLDKAAMLQIVEDGYGAPADVTLSRTSPYFDPSLSYERDLEKAQQVLSELDLEIKDTLVVPNTPIEGPLGEVLQQQMRDLGMDIDLVKLEVPTFLERFFTTYDFGIAVCGYTAAGDPDTLLFNYYHSTGGNNVFGYNNPELDYLLEEARATYDFDERKELYVEIYSILLEDIPSIHMFQTSRYMATSDRVNNLIYKPDLTYIFRETWVD